jgi:DNA-directed RNA polymerase specialized sigma24 family protein
MTAPAHHVGDTRAFLDDISTRWAIVGDPIQFVMRYAPAIEKYLHAIVRDPSVAEEILQDFVVKMLDRRFDRATPDGGRFRGYLKQAIRNAVREHFRRRRPESLPDDMLAEFAVGETADSAAERAWADEWLSRGRRLMAECVWDETAATLEHPHPADVRDELASLGLMEFVGGYLPDHAG